MRLSKTAGMGSNVYQTLVERGFIQQVTDAAAVEAMLASGPQVIYTGYDPTGDSLHVGHLVTLMALKHLEAAGHRPIILLGGGTARVGDPSGKSEMRPLLERQTLAHNVAALGAQVARLLDVAAGKSVVVNNADWLDKLNYIDFLRDVGRHFSVNRMLAAEAYRQRLEHGLSFIEFNYQILQAYDFLTLRRSHGCRLQLGGDDQWGNILAGVDLCRRVDAELVQGLTYPLLTTASGAKMGKTAAGAVWIDPGKLKPYDYYQYWVNVDDADLTRFLKIFTLLPMAEIAGLEDLSGAKLNAAKSILAFESTSMVHGVDVAREVHAAAQGAFGGRDIAAHLLPSSAVPRQAAADAAVIPSTTLTPAQLAQGISLTDLLVMTQLANSKSEARRLVSQGAVRLGEVRAEDPQTTVNRELFAEGALLVRAGKKKVHRVVLAEV
jgi:tyrosyl-tRNA synthetase